MTESAGPAIDFSKVIVTGARLVGLIETAATERGLTAVEFARPLNKDPAKWLAQLMTAQRPKPTTIARVRALLYGEPIPEAAPNSFRFRDRNAVRPYHSTGERGPATWPEPVDRDPCFRCGTRADVGCPHRPQLIASALS